MSLISRLVFGVVSDWQDVLVRDGRMHLYPGAALSRTGLFDADADRSHQYRRNAESANWCV